MASASDPKPQLTHAQVRLDKASTLCRQLEALARHSSAGPTHQATWKLLSGVANQALVFDMCVFPPSLLAPLAHELDTQVMRVTSQLFQLPTPVPDFTQRALNLPREFGGCGLQRSQDRMHMAFLSQVLNNPPLPGQDMTRELAGICTHAAECVDWLQ